jgi:hypothetical protein
MHIREDIETSHVRLTLDDGRVVSVHGDGEIAVYRAESGGLGSEAYSLTLPSCEDAGTQCDRPHATLGHGHFTIQAEHRH